MSPLRIGWAAPWNASSAIAQSAAEVAFALVDRGHEITVLRTETGPWLEAPARGAPGPIRVLERCASHELTDDFDIVVAHFGDHYGFHGALLPRLSELDCVGIFHDMCVMNLLRGWAFSAEGPGLSFQDAMQQMVREAYGAVADGPLRFDDLEWVANHCPMVEQIARNVIAAIGHSEHYAGRLRASCPGPVAVIPLAFSIEGLPPPPLQWAGVTIAVVGHANPNKRIDQIILAVGASYLLRPRCRIRVIGEASSAERQRLTELAETLGVSPPEFTGWVSDDDLRFRLRDVDVMGCLRKPVLEGASASLVVALTSGRPTLVNDHGCYRDVPSDAALICSPDHEALDVLRHLERFVEDPAFGIEVGARGRAFAAGRHSASAYAELLEPILEEATVARPLARAERQLAGTLAEFGLGPTDPALARISAHLRGFVPKI